ncbi:Isocitrate lyase [Dillenia turbinata]|uniref:Isocitrate lyase n=1 Tax=Dillenia turbinata TaxID=194707 RepID=A0AAN8UVM3_9MAGN
MEEEGRFEAEVAEEQAWWNTERFKLSRRPYTTRDVVSLRGTLRQAYPSNELAKKLWLTFKTHQANGTASRTFGALDPVQVAKMAEYLDSISVSGWECSSTHTTNEPGLTLQTTLMTLSLIRLNTFSLLNNTMTESKERPR